MAALEELGSAFNAHDIDRIMSSLFVQDCSLDMPRGREPHGTRFRVSKR